MASQAIRRLPHASPVTRCKARLSAERPPSRLVPQATVEVDRDGVLCPLDARCDACLRLISLSMRTPAALYPDWLSQNLSLLAPNRLKRWQANAEIVVLSLVALNRLAMSKSIELDAVRPVCGAPFSALALAR